MFVKLAVCLMKVGRHESGRGSWQMSRLQTNRFASDVVESPVPGSSSFGTWSQPYLFGTLHTKSALLQCHQDQSYDANFDLKQLTL